MSVAVHVTHEAIQKLGGIGTVLHGLVVSKKYQKLFPRTILYSPLFHRENVPSRRLGPDSVVFYSGLDQYDRANYRPYFEPIENKYGVHIVYGKKKFDRAEVDIIAVDIQTMNAGAVDHFKFKLWEHFSIKSDQFQHDSDYEQYLKIGIVLKEIIETLYGVEEKAVIFSHEYMGMASALSFVIEKREGRRSGDKTVFYAHEVATARRIVEGHPGHDLSFYNIMRIDSDANISLEDEFGSFSTYSRNELVKAAQNLDYFFAVSDLIKDEYKYLCPLADDNKIKVVYNGIPIESVSWKRKEQGRKLIGDYCENLFNFRPDHVMTHVARLVISKAMWRDIRLLYHMDEHFHKTGKKGFFVLLSTMIANGRPVEDITRMEAEYGWPVVHRESWPDLVGDEVAIYKYLELFNARSKAIKGVFVNQFGFDMGHCGSRVPKDATLLDLRLASDMEFGLSIYEPFGIAQLETIPYGGIPLVSSVCGSASLLAAEMDPKDYLSLDFTAVPEGYKDILKTKEDFQHITKEMRDIIETEICLENATTVLSYLPKTDKERKNLFNRLHKDSGSLDWDHVVERFKDLFR